MFKTFILATFAFFCLGINKSKAQSLTLEETVAYINLHLQITAASQPLIKADKYGGVSMYFLADEHYGFSLRDVKIEAQYTEEDGNMLYIGCADGTECMNFVNGNNCAPLKEIFFSTATKKETQRLVKAFAYLKAIAAAKDPFDN